MLVRQALWSFRWRRAHSLPSSRNPSQAAPARAPRPRALPARCLRSTRRPATALVAPSLMVMARVEAPTPARRAIAPAQAPTASRSNVIAWRTQRGDVPLLRSAVHYADSGLWMTPLQTLVSWISVRSPHAARAAPPRKRRAAGMVLLQHRQRHHLCRPQTSFQRLQRDIYGVISDAKTLFLVVVSFADFAPKGRLTRKLAHTVNRTAPMQAFMRAVPIVVGDPLRELFADVGRVAGGRVPKLLQYRSLHTLHFAIQVWGARRYWPKPDGFVHQSALNFLGEELSASVSLNALD